MMKILFTSITQASWNSVLGELSSNAEIREFRIKSPWPPHIRVWNVDSQLFSILCHMLTQFPSESDHCITQHLLYILIIDVAVNSISFSRLVFNKKIALQYHSNLMYSDNFISLKMFILLCNKLCFQLHDHEARK